MFVNTVYGQLTNGQAFNYNANDIIYKEFNYGAAYVLDTIKTKSFSTTSDTIYYVIKSTQYYKTNPTANWSITSSIVNFSISNLSAPVNLPDIISSDTVRKDTAYFSYCNKKSYGNLYKQKNPPPSLSINTIYHKVFYIEGLGGPYKNYDYTNPYSNYNSDVIYYKKGSLTCGTFIAPVGISKIKVNDHFLELYPNPLGEFLYIKTNHDLKNLFLTDLLNKKIELNYQRNENHIDLKNLAPGIYFLTAVFDNKTLIKKIVKH